MGQIPCRLFCIHGANMAVDPDQVIEDAINAPKRVTNAAGETVESKPADEILTLLNLASGRRPKRPPFAVTRAIPPDTVGPRSE